MIKILNTAIWLVVLTAAANVFGQPAPIPPGAKGTVATGWGRSVTATAPPGINRQPPRREALNKPVQAVKVSRETQNRLKVNEADIGTYREILKTGGTGVIKLLPVAECPLTRVVDEKCERKQSEITNNANSFSFQNRLHVPPGFGDIRLFEGGLDAWDNEAQTILTNLGDLPLEKLALDTEGVKYLSDFVPEPLLENAVKQALRFAEGVRDGKYLYSKSVTPQVGDTIALRSIAYPADGTAGAQASDLIVVMKVIKRDADGSLTIIWKELGKRPFSDSFLKA